MRGTSILAGLALAAASLPQPAAAADFPSIVSEILRHQTDGPISRMGPEKKSAMIDCVITALQPLPSGKKRFVQEGGSYEEREQRFGKVVQENRAEWKQKIAKACSKIAVSGGI